MTLVIKDEETALFKSADRNFTARKIQEVEEASQTDIIKQTVNEQGQLILGK
jgi:hypothetical protein